MSETNTNTTKEQTEAKTEAKPKFWSAEGLEPIILLRNNQTIEIKPIQQKRHGKGWFLGIDAFQASHLPWFNAESQSVEELFTRLLNAEIFQPAWKSATEGVEVGSILTQEEQEAVVKNFKDLIDHYFVGGREKKITIESLETAALRLKLEARKAKEQMLTSDSPEDKAAFDVAKSAYLAAKKVYEDAKAKLGAGLDEEL